MFFEPYTCFNILHFVKFERFEDFRLQNAFIPNEEESTWVRTVQLVDAWKTAILGSFPTSLPHAKMKMPGNWEQEEDIQDSDSEKE